ncbi:MAG TPA: SDR family oxidoreductase [Streptosporangiaceae bacterium]|nr:SDR family oxidoreductase [Streptosporangiaceae bacterium]
MTIAVTGASGPFGRHAIEVLLARGVPADQIVAIVRDPAKVADLGERGVTVRRGDYSDPATLRAALAGVDRLLFVSGSEVGQRILQHQAVVDAARTAGVSLIAYTSSPKADTSDMVLAEEHRATEGALIASGVPYVFLRNGWYVENYTRQLPVILEHGLIGAAGDGRISAAARGDLAEAAAVVVASEDGHQNRVYELGGPGFTLAELAAEIGRQSGRDIGYTDLSEDDYAQALVDAGVPAEAAAVYADSDRAAAKGALYIEGDDLERLLGRPATPWPEIIRAALGG